MNKIRVEMTIFWRYGLITLGLLLNHAAIAAASPTNTTQPLDTITTAATEASRSAAAQQGYDDLQIHVRPLDRRLQLPRCTSPLSTFFPRPEQVIGVISVGVKCTGERPWTIYVRTTVEAQQTIPVLATRLARHSVIQASDLQSKRIELSKLPANSSVALHPSQIIGMETTRTVLAQTAIRFSDLRSPKIIKRGQLITLISHGNNLEVRVQGKALKDAAAGESVSIMNTGSGRTVEGIANSDGTVSVR